MQAWERGRLEQLRRLVKAGNVLLRFTTTETGRENIVARIRAWRDEIEQVTRCENTRTTDAPGENRVRSAIPDVSGQTDLGEASGQGPIAQRGGAAAG